jgi:hypothetical protein
MNSVGIDLHRSRSQVAVLDAHGNELLSRRIRNDPATFLELLAEIDGASKIALEATYGWGGSPTCSRTPATSCTSRIRSEPRRSPRRASRPTPSTHAHSPTCCAPTSCRRPTSRRARCASCATSCATAWR